MAETDTPQIYLVTPPEIDLELFPARLAKVLDAAEIACVRMALGTQDEDVILRAGDALREVAHARDVPLVIERHVLMVERLGLDGVHLMDAARSVRKVRKDLGQDAIVGAFCGTSRHDGIGAAEAGADYISFGPVGGALGDGTLADHDLFGWWSEMIELPVVAEGGLDEAVIRALAPITDFFAVGEEIWRTEDAAATLKRFLAAMA
ncbi:MAG TPA: thiamine phosphate synthase [Rhodobacteraceae bacterium]|jgi:thiamine-phosphate pyrophosphorylase|nr:thiamine phosphate synthase [Paracoccaceae bacterium]